MRLFPILLSTLLLFSNPILSLGNPDSLTIENRFKEVVNLQKEFKPKEAQTILDSIANQLKEEIGSSSKLKAKLHYYSAYNLLDLAQYNKAKENLISALNIFEVHDSISLELGDTYLLLGIYYDYMGKYDQALRYYNRTKHIYTKLFNPNDPRFGYLYNNIAICIYFQGDVERAINFFYKSLGIKVENFGLNNNSHARTLSNISITFSKLKNLSKSKNSIFRAITIAKNTGLINTSKGAIIFQSYAILYHHLKKYDKAISSIDKALKIRYKVLPENHPDIANSFFLKALIYYDNNEIVKATEFYKRALEIYKKSYSPKHRDVGHIYTKLAQISLKNQNLRLALEQINKALDIFEYDEYVNLNKDQIFDINILETLELKAQIHKTLWSYEMNILHLKKADKIYTDLITIFNKFRQGFKEEESKELLASDYYHIFEDAIGTSYFLYEATKEKKYIEVAFRRCEYSMGFVLLEKRREKRAKIKANIPDSLLIIEQKLKTEIANLEKQRQFDHNRTDSSDYYVNTIFISSQIFDLKEKLASHVQQYEQKHPLYFHHKYDISTIKIQQLQDYILKEDQSLIEYFIGTQHIFIFTISKNETTLTRVEKSMPLEDLVTRFRVKIEQFEYPFNLEKGYNDSLVNLSTTLYQILIAPIESQLNQRIVIIPNGNLAQIPFDCLIKSASNRPEEYSRHDYLIKHHAISYCYSASLLAEMINNNRLINSNHKTIAFAPNFKDFGSNHNFRDLFLLPLKHNKEEATHVAKLMHGTLIKDHSATEQYFLDNYQKYSIIHIASHAKADDLNGDFGFMAFSEVKDTIENELLFVKDIYQLPLRAEMVTLSACETGIGEDRKGEGIISLARSFSYAGTSNINTSLWNVSDLKTAELMKIFYKNISNGVPKDISLQQAKIKLINSNTHNNYEVHPFYWTAMISIGDSKSIQVSKGLRSYFWLLALLVLIIGAGYLYLNQLKTT